MVIVTGATGNYGRHVVDFLLEKVPASELGVSVREPQKASDLLERGVRVRRGDFADPSSLHDAFEGATQVLIVSGTTMGDDGVRQHGNAIDAAKVAGAQRILYSSHAGASSSATFVPNRISHAPTEKLLQASGVPFVSLRNGFYAESAMFQLQGLAQTGKIALPADGPVNWTARKDLAEAAAAVLVNPALLPDGISPPLTGPEALDFTAIAQLASEVLGRDIPRETVSDEDYRQAVVARGIPEVLAENLVTLYTAARAGELAETDPTLERILKRKPTSMKDILREFLSSSEKKIIQ